MNLQKLFLAFVVLGSCCAVEGTTENLCSATQQALVPSLIQTNSGALRQTSFSPQSAISNNMQGAELLQAQRPFVSARAKLSPKLIHQYHNQTVVNKNTLHTHGKRLSGAISGRALLAKLEPTPVSTAGRLLSKCLIVVSGSVSIISAVFFLWNGIPQKSDLELSQGQRSGELSWSTFILVTLFFGASGFCTDQFIPSLPHMAAEFGVSEETMSTSLQINWLVSAIGTFAAGILSDRLGRRPVMLVLMFTLIISTAASALAPSFGWFLAGRILQGIGESGGAVVAALFRDYYDDPLKRATMFGWAEMIKMVGPVIAPPVGGIIASSFGWRPVFLGLSVFIMFLFAASCISIEESVMKAEDTAVLSDLEHVLSDHHRVVLIMADSFLWGYHQTLLSNVSYVYENDYNLSLITSSLLIGLIALAIVLGINYTQVLLEFQGDIIKSASFGFLALCLPIGMTVAGSMKSTGVAYYTSTIFMTNFLCMTPIISIDSLFSQSLKNMSGTAFAVAWAMSGICASILSILGSALGALGPRALMMAFALQLAAASTTYGLGFGLSPPKWALEACEEDER